MPEGQSDVGVLLKCSSILLAINNFKNTKCGLLKSAASPYFYAVLTHKRLKIKNEPLGTLKGVSVLKSLFLCHASVNASFG